MHGSCACVIEIQKQAGPVVEYDDLTFESKLLTVFRNLKPHVNTL